VRAMRQIAIFIFTVLLVGHGYATPGSAIAGRVLDRDSRSPLPSANISIAGTSIGTSTDQEGRFRIAGLEPGTFELRFSYIGYATELRTVDVGEDSTVTIDVLLTSSVIPGQQITVTATRGRLRETPTTFSTLEHRELRERYTTQDVPVLLSELPSTTFYSESGNNIGYTYLNIRGFDARRIAVMVNGIPQNDPEDHNVYWLDMPDIASTVEDVQVQRGAGNAFYGSPAIGGSVNLVTSQFGRDRGLALSAGLGSYNTRRYAASFSSGLIANTYAVHARLSKTLSSGYRDRAWVDFNSYFLGVIRYDENMTTQINLYGGPITDGLAYYGIPKEDVTDVQRRRENPIQRPEESESFSQPHYELLHEWRITPSTTLSNTLFYVYGDGYFDYDGSWAPLSYYRLAPQYGFAISGDPDTLYLPGALIRAQVTNRQWGWLPRVTLKQEHREIILGAELRVHRSLHWGRLQWTQELPAGVPYDYRYYEYKGAKDIASVYLHTLHDIDSHLKMMADLQYAYSRYHLYDEKFVQTDFAVPYHFLNPRLGLNYNIDDRWHAYISLAYTSREPRLKNLYDAAEASTPASWGAVVPQFAVEANGRLNFGAPLVKPEALFDLELGGGFGNESVQASANVYWMEFADEIVKSGQVDRFGQPITGNADRTRHIGLELSGMTRPVDNLEITGNVTISRNRLIRHTDYSTGSALTLDGNPIAGFPDVLANMRLTYRHDHLMLSLSGRYVGKQYTDNFSNEGHTVDPFFVSDASGSFTFERVFSDVDLMLRLQVNNVFDTLYATYGEGAQFFVGAERNMYFGLTVNL
jgi:iron complex outermembrane recepter protein